MLPHVVRWNAGQVGERYAELLRVWPASRRLTLRARDWQNGSRSWRQTRRAACDVARDGVPRDDLSALAEDAATQWTGTFNPRPFDAAAALALYERAF